MDPFLMTAAETAEDQARLNEARQDVQSLHDAVADLRRQVEGQRVLLRALFALLQERSGLTEADLLAHFHRAAADRSAAPAKMCTRCGRPVSLKFERCLYCEAPQPATSAFELV